jgi:hypothetical protein
VLGLDEAERDVRSVIALLREQARGLAGELALVDREMDRAYEALRPRTGEPDVEDEAPSGDDEEAPAAGAADAASENGGPAEGGAKAPSADAATKATSGDGPQAGDEDDDAATASSEDEGDESDDSATDEPSSKSR